MKPFVFSLACMLGFAVVGNAAWAQDTDAAAIQAFLEKSVGEWMIDAVVYPPDGGEFYAEGTDTTTMVGPWVTSSSEIVEAQIAFHAVIGFDEGKQKIVGVSVASNKSVMIFSEGEFNADREELVMFMEGENMAGQTVKQKEVTTFPDDDERITEIYQRATDDDEWELLIELAYTRKEH